MTNDDVDGFVLHDKPVLDWNQNQVGTVDEVTRDPATEAAEELVVSLTSEARSEMAEAEEQLEIPLSYVFGIRRDSVTLDRSLDEISRMEKETEAPEVQKLLKP